MTKDEFVAFVTSPKAQVAERAFLSASGWGGIHIMQWLGINPVQTGSLTEVIVQATPFLAGLAWGLYAMLEAKIVARAGAILAAKKDAQGNPVGEVKINTATAPQNLVNVVLDPNAKGVNPQ